MENTTSTTNQPTKCTATCVSLYLSETCFPFCCFGFPPLGRTLLPHSAPPPVRQPEGWWGDSWGFAKQSLRLRSRAPWRGSCKPAAWRADAGRHLSSRGVVVRKSDILPHSADTRMKWRGGSCDCLLVGCDLQRFTPTWSPLSVAALVNTRNIFYVSVMVKAQARRSCNDATEVLLNPIIFKLAMIMLYGHFTRIGWVSYSIALTF